MQDLMSQLMGQSLGVFRLCKQDPPNLLVFQLKDNSVSTLKVFKRRNFLPQFLIVLERSVKIII